MRAKRTGLCVCGSKRPFQGCCGPFVLGGELAGTPEQLMRSRYTAYAVGAADYIIATTDSEGPRWIADVEEWSRETLEFGRTCDFLGVVIHDSSFSEDRGEVHFTARLGRKREDVSFSERSTFVRRQGKWLYHSGEST